MSYSPEGATLQIHLKGSWTIGQDLPSAREVTDHVAARPGTGRITFDHSGLTDWDSGLLTFLVSLQNRCAASDLEVDINGLPQGVIRLLSLAREFKELEEPLDRKTPETFLAAVGSRAIGSVRYFTGVLEFIGEASVALTRLVRGRARFRRSDLGLLFSECGAQALPIVSLISILVGLILAFVGVVQLRMFGAQIYIANLVGIAMAREMGAMMTAIIMMGRTGAAYATQLGTMEVNEEIDALKTLGISPMEFLVMPRMLALILMMPLLTVYADLVGILGGALVGVGMFDLSTAQYWEQTVKALNLNQFAIGVSKSAVFAVLIAASGCFHGMHSERSASAVGYAATRAVVVGIVLIVVTDGIFAIITSTLGI
ncbi:MAG TPA: ABC transporter permease [Deltaproteobacteria bacterium]|nr:ABC transporter permease [Deltaproteobacteria bacterium]